MIAWIALASGLVAGPRIAEVPEPGSDRVVVEALVPALPNMDEREQAAWSVIGDALYDGTAEFSRDRLLQYGAQSGEGVLIETWPSFIKIRVVEPKEGLRVGALIVESLLLRGSLTNEAITASCGRLARRTDSAWGGALLDLVPPYKSVTFDQVRNVYQQAFRVDRIAVVVGGAIEPGEGTKEIADRLSKPIPLPPRRSRFDRLPQPRASHTDPVTTFEWRGAPFALASPDGPAKVLAVTALGVGKESSMFRILREKLGWSYRQEALLWPEPAGWTPRALFARTSDLAKPEDMATARDALDKDIDAWDETTLARANAVLAASLDGTGRWGPFWTSLSGPYSASLNDSCTWAGLSLLSSGTVVGVGDLLSSCRTVKLEELRSAGHQTLDEARGQVIEGR